MVISDIRGMIDARDEYLMEQKDAEKRVRAQKEALTQFNHIYLGSPRKPVKISSLAEAHGMDEAFVNFSKKLKSCIQDLVSRQSDDDRLRTSRPVARRDVEVYETDEVSHLDHLIKSAG